MGKKKTVSKRGGARENAGRKAKYQNPVNFSVKCESAFLDELVAVAQDLGKSKNELVVELLEKGLKQKQRSRRKADL